MVFSSTIFLFLFLPLVLLAHTVVPWRPAQNIILLIASLLFYAWGEPVYVVLMVVSIVANWAFGLLVGRFRNRWVLGADVVFNLLILCFFKYETFLAQNINGLIGAAVVPDLQLPLPIGISFFTLQALTYVIDVYREDCRPQRNLLYLGMYISMFPQLVAGPIVRYSHIEDQIDHRVVTLEGFAQGIRLFSVGMGKKVLLANVCGTLADSLLAQDAATIGWVGCFSGVLAYTFQIYFDFSGYSDMAQGLGKMLGFDFPRNFNYPYISRSVTEFWRRWHISLGSFFRDYLYIPLGGNRVSQARWMLNIAVVWGVTGLWHGAAWNFVLWGLYYGLLLMCEKLFLLKWLQRLPAIVGHLYTLVAVFIGWLFFSVSGLHNIAHWGLGLLGAYGLTGTSTLWELTSWEYLSAVPLMIAACTPVVPWLRCRLERWASGDKSPLSPVAPAKGYVQLPPCLPQVEHPESAAKARVIATVGVVSDVALVIILVLSCMSVASSSYNPFIYFQF